jgi:chromosome segregation ATPase
MVLKKYFSKFWKSKNSDPELTPEYIESLPAADDITFHRDSKRLLQRFDEHMTAAETEVEVLSIELDTCLDQQSSLELQLKHLNKPNSWHERHLLLKLDRLHLHCNNLKRRIEIYSQNISIYLNMMSKIQDIYFK